METTPVYNLTWGEYGTSLISAVQHLRCHGELVDVTLAAGGRTFHAHKVVLCAASPFLLDLLKSTTCKHPVVMLAGVQAADLEALLEFVYRGEVSIDPNQLPSLLQAAHCLNIQGLAPSPPPVHTESIQQHELKTTSEATKVEMLEVTTNATSEGELPIKRKKRAKRSRSPSSSIHSEKVYIQSSDIDENVQEIPQNAPIWTQQMSIINVATPIIDAMPNQPLSSVHDAVTPLKSNSSDQSQALTVPASKMKGASEQPGVCPLCGAMLRQARNLRRHLGTSCKYRMLNGVPHSSSQSVLHSGRELTQLQAVSVQNIEQVTQSNVDRLENKSLVLTPISCTELISPNPNVISVTSGNML